VTTYGVLSVNVGLPGVLLPWPDGDVISSMDKSPVQADMVTLSRTNLDGDRQADTRPSPMGGQVHGGLDQAVYAFPSEHFERLGEIVGSRVAAGFIGENITLQGVTEGDVCIGDIWTWGTARLQVTAPRGPCYKLGIRIGRQAARTIVREEGLVGWYLRVLTPGEVPTRGPIVRAQQHPQKVTVADIHRALQDRGTAYPELAALAPLSAKVKTALLRRDRDLTGGVPEAD
jgi:MOSC domain-containing protein YiiM